MRPICKLKMGLCGPEGGPSRDIMAANGRHRSGTNKQTPTPSFHTLSNLPLLVWPCPLHLYLSPPLHLPFLCRRFNLLSRTSLPAIMSDSKGRLSFFLFFSSLLKFLAWWSAGSVCTSYHVDVNSGLRFDVGSFIIGCRVMLFYETV